MSIRKIHQVITMLQLVVEAWSLYWKHKHLFSFKQRVLIIADNLSCLILGGFYWHGCSIRSGGMWWGQQGSSQKKDTQRLPKQATKQVTNPNKPPHRSQATTVDEPNVQKTIRVHAVLLKPLRGPSPSVLAFQCFAWPRKINRLGDLLLFYHCVLIVYEYIYDMEQQNTFYLLHKHGQFSQTWSHINNCLFN